MIMRCFKFLLCLIITSFFVTACANSGSRNKVNQLEEEPFNSAQPEPTVNTSLPEEKSTLENNTPDMIQKTKDFILKGQSDQPEANQLIWSESFLNQVDLEAVYKDYLDTGGSADDVEGFAKYLTLNAPILDNWKELFVTDLLNAYGQEVSRMELLEDNLYQVYVKIEGSEVPYVVVNARTGYFHG